MFSERLYDEGDGLGGGGLYSPGGGRAAGRAEAFVDAFRSLPREGDAGAGGEPGGSALGSLFDPPTEMTFKGNFEAAKACAAEDDRWLMVNVQSHTEFASMQLNRDTWSSPAVQEVVRAAFVFYQPHESTTEGRKLKTYYKVSEAPTILVLDPVTGQRLWERTGFIEGAALLEDLAPFFDTSPASGLPRGAAGPGGNKRRLPQQGGGAAREASPGRARMTELSEDEQLARAIQDSLQEAGAARAGPGAAGGPAAEDGASVPPAVAAERPEERAARAEAALPAEPPAGDASGCSVAVRLPDGSRLMRRFPLAAPLAALYDFCVSRGGEAAASRPFTLRLAVPGGAALEDRAISLQDAGVAGQCLRMSWTAD